MKRNGPVTSILSILVALWFQVTMGIDAFGAHRCPHHDVVPDAASGAPAAMAADAHASHGATHDADQDDHGPCTCTGQCSTTSGPVLTASPAADRLPDASSEAVALTAAASQPTHRLIRYLRPFSTAPPSTLTA